MEYKSVIGKRSVKAYRFFLTSAQRDMIPRAKNSTASIQLLLRNAFINAIPKNNMKTAKFENFISLIYYLFYKMTF